MLGQRRGRWPNIEPASGQRLVRGDRIAIRTIDSLGWLKQDITENKH